MSKFAIFSGNTLKLLAALFMLIDHVGYYLFPKLLVLRCIGRLAFPIFAFMISEGARYTRNKLKYILGMSSLAIVYHCVLYFFDNKNLHFSILATFSLSLAIIYALQGFKHAVFSGDKRQTITATGLLIFTTVLVYLFTRFFKVEYGFVGILAPVCASVFDFRGIPVPERFKKLDNLYLRVLCTGAALLFYSINSVKVQLYCLLALPILMLYSEERGRLKLKYFFYAFYPLHVLFLKLLACLLK